MTTTTSATEEATKAMENLTVVAAAAPVRGTAKRDALRSNEKSVQQKWEAHKAFELSLIHI